VVALVIATLFGAVTIGPVTPVCQVGIPCDKPAVNATLTFTRRGHTFAATTDAAGHYRVKVPPGIYAVRASVGMSMRPRNINVHAPSTRLNFSVDTGIR
jgi:Carboxypeptidase regulatory-like domain